MAIAVFDIGKTNRKLSLVDAGAIRHTVAAPNRSLPGPPYLHYDAEAIWRFLLKGLRDFAQKAKIADIVVVAHGAAGALIDAEGGLALPILDYEHPLEDPEYDAVAAPFTETYAPPMANGLNVGRQLHWQARQFPEGFARTRHFLTYPQYWSFRLSGVAACEATSLACHTGLWRPAGGGFSSFVDRMGWRDLFPPLVKADAVLGPVLPEIRKETGLPEDCRVRAGIHDSSASFLRHRLSRPLPFAVASTGTWVVCMAAGADPHGLPENRNCLANVDALGTPVPCCVFMGGREFSLLTKDLNGAITTLDAIDAVVARGSILVPPVAETGGPFAHLAAGGPRGAGIKSQEESVARASLYLALMTDYCFDLIKAAGPIVVEGSLIGNTAFLRGLAALRAPEPVLVSKDATGTISGAVTLAGERIPDEPLEVEPLEQPIAAYRRAWREALPA